MGRAGGKMKMRTFILFTMLALVLGAAVWEQVYIDNTIKSLQVMGNQLYIELQDEDINTSKQIVNNLNNYWNKRQTFISLMVDFRDIESIGRQCNYIMANLNNNDFELARTECLQFNYVVQNFANMTHFDVHNIF